MSLLIGDLMTPDAWQLMLPFVRGLSARHIAQIWLHHANDLGKGFRTKTREWEMDLVGTLARVEDDENAIKLEFTKSRLRTPHNFDQFAPRIIRPGDDWRIEIGKGGAAARRKGDGMTEIIRSEYVNAYERLADGVRKSHGLDAKLVRKVRADAVRDELKSRGFLDVDDNGKMTAPARHIFRNAKAKLLRSRTNSTLATTR
jgi:hypothetical protein